MSNFEKLNFEGPKPESGESKTPPFEEDDFKYDKPVLEKEPGKKLEEAVDLQKDELKKEAGGRFKGVGGFFGKAAVAIAAIFGGAGEGKPAEPVEKPAPVYKIPQYKYEGPGYKNPMEGSKEKGEFIVTSKSISDLLGGRKVRDLGDGRFAVHKGGTKYTEIGEDCIEEMRNIQKKYTIQYGRTRFTLRADAMKDMRTDLKAAIKKMGEEIEIKDDVPYAKVVEEPKIEKKAVSKKTTVKKDKSGYDKDKGAYDYYDK